MHAPAKLESNPFDWTDPLLLGEELSEDERQVRDSCARLLPGMQASCRG